MRDGAYFFRPLAEQGNSMAQFNLGLMYEYSGVSQDDAAAVSWYRKAADQGDARAQFNLGFMYNDGRGVLQDDVAAVSWYRKAAGQGNARSSQARRYVPQRPVCCRMMRLPRVGIARRLPKATPAPNTFSVSCTPAALVSRRTMRRR